jgi:glycosyltransferase involved in cell wall biosynthesis
MDWHLITPEYPPQSGGVSDYTYLVATGLAALGETVHVWCPALEERTEVRGQRSDVRGRKSEIGGQRSEERNEPTLFVHRELGRFSVADLRRVGKLLDQFPAPRRLLVQWVPQGYGYRSINLPFCLWLWQRAKFKHDRIEIMVHEPFLAFAEGSRKQDMAAATHRAMVAILLNAATRVWVSIPEWEAHLQPFVLGGKKPFECLPVPSNIPLNNDPEAVARIRSRFAPPNSPLVGHFGAYDDYMIELMMKLLPSLLRGYDKLSVMLLGKGSLELRDRLIELHPGLSQSVRATGTLSAEDLSRHISACDVMLQPYQDGVSGRRGSVMAALSHGIPVVTTTGKATEDCWIESGAVKLTEVEDTGAMVEATQHLLANEEARNAMAARALELYRKRFDIRNTISALCGSKIEDLCPGIAVS